MLRECLERVPENIDAMRELLQYGLRGTDLEVLIAIGKGEDGGEVSGVKSANMHERTSCESHDMVSSIIFTLSITLSFQDIMHSFFV